MNQARVGWELACKAFSLMNVMEQATVLTIYRHTSGPIVESWINSVYKVCAFENFDELDEFLDEITDARNELANKMEA